MVALTQAAHPARAHARGSVWLFAGGLIVLVGAAIPLLLSPRGPGYQASGVLVLLIGGCLWAGSLLLTNPRGAAVVALISVVVLNLNHLPAPYTVNYDSEEALWQTDQQVETVVPIPTGLAQPVLTALVHAEFAGDQPTFGVHTTIGAQPADWTCLFTHGRQELAFPLGGSVPSGRQTLDVTLSLTGQPRRDSSYLIAFGSNQGDGYVMAVVDGSALDPAAVRCQVR